MKGKKDQQQIIQSINVWDRQVVRERSTPQSIECAMLRCVNLSN